MPQCSSVNCFQPAHVGSDFCFDCMVDQQTEMCRVTQEAGIGKNEKTMSAKYPQYFKDVTELTEVDVYAIHHLFEVDDPAGCIQHASKKLLLSGVRTGGKSKYQDIKEARDTLNRWLELNS